MATVLTVPTIKFLKFHYIIVCNYCFLTGAFHARFLDANLCLHVFVPLRFDFQSLDLLFIPLAFLFLDRPLLELAPLLRLPSRLSALLSLLWRLGPLPIIRSLYRLEPHIRLGLLPILRPLPIFGSLFKLGPLIKLEHIHRL